MASFELLSDHEFELIVGDLVGAEKGVRFEAFTRGPDQGIDLRHRGPSGETIIQCRNYPNARGAAVASSLTADVTRWTSLPKAQRPAHYILATSAGLTPRSKSALEVQVAECATRSVLVLGRNDLETLIRQYPQVERGYVKLWLTGSEHLKHELHSATHERARRLLKDVTHSLSWYVDTARYSVAREKLRGKHVLVISGPPGIGKTTLGKLLVADAVADGFELVPISADVEEADSVFDQDAAQVFFYDDFLGANFLESRLSKNEDRRLADLIRRCANSSRHLLIMTTREYILRQALDWYEEFERAGLPLMTYLLELDAYSKYERAQIFVSHLRRSSSVPATAVRDLLTVRRLDAILNHAGYNPRLIEHVTGNSAYRLTRQDHERYFEFVMRTLDRPDLVWSKAFDRQIDEYGRLLVLLVASAGPRVDLPVLHQLWQHADTIIRGAREQPALTEKLEELSDSFLDSELIGGTHRISLANPGLRDYCAQWIGRRPPILRRFVAAFRLLSQVEWVVDHVLPGAGTRDEEVLRSCFNLVQSTAIPSAYFVAATRIGGLPGSEVRPRRRAWSIIRLRLALDIASRLDDPAVILPEIQRDLDLASDQVAHEPIFPSALSSVAVRSADLGLNVSRFVRRSTDLIEAEAHYIEAWEALAELVDRFGHTELSGRHVQLKSACSAWANAELTFDIEFFGDPDEVDAVLDVAEKFEVTVPAATVATARARLELSDVTPARPARDQPTPLSVAIADEDSMIEHLFASFLTEGSHSILPLLNALYGWKPRR